MNHAVDFCRLVIIEQLEAELLRSIAPFFPFGSGTTYTSESTSPPAY